MKPLELAQAICSCPEVQNALENEDHPCRKVVLTQTNIARKDTDMRQRPEPWIGNLEKARILFISSNPSISDHEDIQIREDFPTYGMSERNAAEFFIKRFDNSVNPPHATFNYPGYVDFLYRSNDGVFRGKGNSTDKSIETWKGIFERAKEILGPECNPNENYALTEVVKCKSKKEEGVKDASDKCIEKWMSSVLQIAKSRIVIVVGAPARDNFAHKIKELGSEFGANSKRYPELGQRGRAIRDIKLSNFGGTARIYVFNWHPTSMIPRKGELIQLKNAYGSGVVDWLRKVAFEQAPIPSNSEELKNLMIELTSN